MLNRSASLAMSTSVLKALPGKLDIKRHSPSILYVIITNASDLSNFDKIEELNALANLSTFFWLTYQLLFFVFTSIYPNISFHSTCT